MDNRDPTVFNKSNKKIKFKILFIVLGLILIIPPGIIYALHITRLHQQEQEHIRLQQERIRLDQERAQKFENYKNSINRVINNLAELDKEWKIENEKLFNIGNFNNNQIVFGKKASGGVGFSSISDQKQTLVTNIQKIEEKVKNEVQEGLDISDNYYNDAKIDPNKIDIVQQKRIYFRNVLFQINNKNNLKSELSPRTGDASIDQALNEFPSDQNLRELVNLWKAYKDTYDKQENDLSNRVRIGQLPASALQNYISDSDYRANQREAERLIEQRILLLRQNH